MGSSALAEWTETSLTCYGPLNSQSQTELDTHLNEKLLVPRDSGDEETSSSVVYPLGNPQN